MKRPFVHHWRMPTGIIKCLGSLCRWALADVSGAMSRQMLFIPSNKAWVGSYGVTDAVGSPPLRR